MRIGSLPVGTRGFDCNTTVTPAMAHAFFNAPQAYRFGVRYVRRTTPHTFDLSAVEIQTFLGAGLGLQVVQHVAPPGWSPNGGLGQSYGGIAAQEAVQIELPSGVQLWCDLEGVKKGVPAQDVIDFCNAWHDAVKAAGYAPGLYVGDSCGLTAEQLYFKLKFGRYWSAYNLNRDQYPVVRGVCMRQLAYPEPDTRVRGITVEYDENIIVADRQGGTPMLLLP